MSMELQFAPVIEPMVLDFAPAPTASAEFAAAYVGPMGRVEGGLNLIGTLPDMEDLPETATSGDAYIIEGYLHVWTQGGWLNAGPMGGVPGPKGDAGEPGPKGADGDPGPAGPAGPKGDTGDTGPQGIQGVQGVPGPAGADGAAGADGDSAYAVAVANGFVGTEAEWLASLVGPKGDTGDTGPQGIQGIQGEPGPKGDTGDTGPAGPAGADGATGPAGTTTWAGITDKPAVIAAGADAAAARSAIGIDNVDNTSDAEKPVSTAQAAAIAERYGRNNILGTVSQSAGVPTGSVIERGINADGEYVRLADGTQITKSYKTFTVVATFPTGSLFSLQNSLIFIFPAAFINDPFVASSININGSGMTTSLSTISTSSAWLDLLSSVSVTKDIGITLLAVGRWYV